MFDLTAAAMRPTARQKRFGIPAAMTSAIDIHS